MKRPVVHHYSTSLEGGAGIACIRAIKHIDELKQFDQKVFTLYPKGQRLKIHIIHRSLLGKLIIFLNKFFGRLFVIRNQRFEVFDFGNGFLSRSENPDITHIHWVTQFLKINSFIKPNGRYVWTLHDLAPITGGCHYFWDCNGYQNNCHNCPQTRLNKIHQRASVNLLAKIETFKKNKAKLMIIATSEFSYQAARKSALVKSSKDIDVVKIPLGIDTDVFVAHKKRKVREELGLAPTMFTICFGAENLESYRKGGDLFKKLLQKLANLKLDIQVITFGTGDFSKLNFPFKSYHMGPTFIESDLAKIYSSANLFLALSRQEAFGQTAQESMSCGTPVLCFENTGFEDQVINEENGYVIPMENIDIALEKIKHLFNSTSLQEKFQLSARNYIKKKFDKTIVAEAHANLYRELLK